MPGSSEGSAIVSVRVAVAVAAVISVIWLGLGSYAVFLAWSEHIGPWVADDHEAVAIAFAVTVLVIPLVIIWFAVDLYAQEQIERRFFAELMAMELQAPSPLDYERALKRLSDSGKDWEQRTQPAASLRDSGSSGPEVSNLFGETARRRQP